MRPLATPVVASPFPCDLCQLTCAKRLYGLPGAGQPEQETVTAHWTWLQEAEQRQAAEEAAKSGDDANDLEKAQDFGRLRTMKVQQAVVTGQRSMLPAWLPDALRLLPVSMGCACFPCWGLVLFETRQKNCSGMRKCSEMPSGALLRCTQQQPPPLSQCLPEPQCTCYSQHPGLHQKYVMLRPSRLCGGQSGAHTHAAGAATACAVVSER